MRRLVTALISPFHVTLLLIAVAASLTFLVIDMSGWGDPDYRRLCILLILPYVVGVVIELRPSSHRRHRS
jgi:hypothetical protein